MHIDLGYQELRSQRRVFQVQRENISYIHMLMDMCVLYFILENTESPRELLSVMADLAVFLFIEIRLISYETRLQIKLIFQSNLTNLIRIALYLARTKSKESYSVGLSMAAISCLSDSGGSRWLRLKRRMFSLD